MNFQDRLKRLLKPRFAIFYPFVIFAAFFANPDDKSILAGVWFIICGLIIRLWANGYAIKSEKLTTCGPYAYVRHPLYIGTIFLAAGLIIMLRIYCAGALFLAIMAAVYYRTIKKEERMLEERFKDLYVEYKKKVPAVVPAIFPYRKGEKWPFSLRRLINSLEYKLSIWMAVIVIAIHLKYKLTATGGKIGSRTLMLIIIASTVGIFELVSEFIRSKNKKTTV